MRGLSDPASSREVMATMAVEAAAVVEVVARSVATVVEAAAVVEERELFFSCDFWGSM